jgi:small subunit ribosomal protein S6e
MEIKLVISNTKTGKSHQRIVKDADAKRFVGMKIGDSVKGEAINLAGYEFQITGGSDFAGFPMRRDIPGILRKKILAVSGVGLRKAGKGLKQRKTVAGNTVHEKTSQINLKILKEGKMPLGEEKAEGAEEPKKEAAAK